MSKDTLSTIDLIELNDDYETVSGLHYPKPGRIINYSDDPEPGNGFTEDEEELNKQENEGENQEDKKEKMEEK